MSTSPELSQILKTTKIMPAQDELRPQRKPRNQGVPELDDQVFQSYEREEAYDIGPLDEDYFHTLKLALQKSARYLSRIHNEDIRVSVSKIRLSAPGKVRLRFEAHPPRMLGTAVVAANKAKEERARKRRRGS